MSLEMKFFQDICPTYPSARSPCLVLRLMSKVSWAKVKAAARSLSKAQSVKKRWIDFFFFYSLRALKHTESHPSLHSLNLHKCPKGRRSSPPRRTHRPWRLILEHPQVSGSRWMLPPEWSPQRRAFGFLRVCSWSRRL